MIRKHGRFSARPLVVVLSVGLCASTSAFGGGGRGGGDSSMNPYTGDSYAYFNGGHNLGEEGMNIPWRKPVPQSTISIKRGAPNATNPSAEVQNPTRAFRSVETSGDQHTQPENK